MTLLLVMSIVAGAVMAYATVRMLRPAGSVVWSTELLLRSLTATTLATGVTVSVGALVGADEAPFLFALAMGVPPVAVLLSASAEEAAPGDRRTAWALVLGWALVTFPASVIVPQLVLRACGTAECRVEDFGGALALLVSSSAFTLLAWRAHVAGPEQGWRGFALPALGLWAGAVTWLVSLEGVFDAYVPRIALAALLAPAAGAAAWFVVDVLRQAERHPLRSLADGLLAGLVAILPGAATISFPWSVVVGASAGAAAGLVYGAKRIASAGRAAHWALVVLTSTAIGYFAPAMVGDTVGFLFSGRIGALFPPLAVFVAVAVLGVLVSAPVWALRRRS